MDEKILDRITALLAKAERTTPEEAEALSEKAEELMLKYCIDQAVIDARRQSGAKAEEIITKSVFYYGSYEHGHVNLATYVGQALQLGVLVTRGVYRPTGYGSYGHSKGTVVHIVGYESDVKQALILIASLQIQAVVATRAWWRSLSKSQQRLRSGVIDRRQFITAFGLGASARIAARRQALINEASTGTDLVLLNRADKVRDATNDQATGEDKTKIKEGSLDATVNGYKAGKLANTGDTQIDNNKVALTS